MNHIEAKRQTMFPEVHYAVRFGSACTVPDKVSYYVTDIVGLLPEG